MPKWNISLAPNSERQALQIKMLPEPFGFCRELAEPHVEHPKKMEMIENKLMEMATAPKMQLFMTFMIVYFMIGNTVSIYSIFAVVQSIVSSVGSILKTNKVFEAFEDRAKSLTMYKMIYAGINLLCLGVVVYKLSKMGLLSFSPSAYIDMIPNYEGSPVVAQI